ncbi:MAG: ABC transporter permease [Epsilonproteobacteria bacterium]|nr:ABC transporter permease [Campylobacterota bacterium]
MKSFKAIFLKEILVFLRNVGLVVFIIYAFTLEVYTAANGIKVKPKHVSIGYVNYGGKKIPLEILSHFHSPEFKKPKEFLSEEALKKAVFDRRIMVGLIFEDEFAKNFYKNKAKINVLVDSTAAAQAQVTLIYLNQILLNLSGKEMKVDFRVHKLFNQNSNSTWFMSVTMLINVVTMLVLILVSIVFVKEKERGTWDIMLLMPVDGRIIIFAKVLSQIAVIMAGIFMSVGLVIFGVFDTPINGNLWVFFLLSFIFSLALSGIALVIAAFSKSVMQVAQVSLLVMLPLLFLSGAWTPITSMAPFLQKLTVFSPVRYYIEGTQAIFFKGSAFSDLLPYFAAESVIAIVLFYIGYKKIGRLF